MKSSFIDKIAMYIFGAVIMALGWLVADKLTSINNSMSEIRGEMKELRTDQARQDKEIWRHEQLLEEEFSK